VGDPDELTDAVSDASYYVNLSPPITVLELQLTLSRAVRADQGGRRVSSGGTR